MAEFAELIKTFGWPGSFLVALGVLFWRVCVFLQPYLKSMFDSHLEFVAEAIKQTHNQSEILEQMKTQQSAFLDSMKNQHGDKIDLLRSMQSQHSETTGMIREMHRVILGEDYTHTKDGK